MRMTEFESPEEARERLSDGWRFVEKTSLIFLPARPPMQLIFTPLSLDILNLLRRCGHGTPVLPIGHQGCTVGLPRV